ncbi:MobF family relaxase [Planctobacterium marinum]|uniref:TrwC relaxase domain-containing protein n=1 Tax=Planctobacterium marinum TaxID=1631968 RepID=A0AA48KQ20_9ALTE|nr:hypothetical protein MACH26_01430 [Planctobacterium marinum]
MLATAPVKNVGYYEDLAAEDYYLTGGEPPGRWFGEGAESLGLTGIVDEKHFSNLMAGLSSDGKEKLCQNVDNSNRVPAYDNVFSPDKSVSITWASVEPDERQLIQDAHDAAVRAALTFLEEKAAYTRRGRDGACLEKLSGLVIGTYQHSTSREQDMHLHTHAVIMNLGQREDGTWGSIVGRFLYTWRTAAAAVYQSQLAKEVSRLGYKINIADNGKSFAITGVSPEICKVFSKRSIQIEDAMNKYGAGARASKLGDDLSKYTRTKKTEIDRPALFSKWQRELVENGFDVSTLKLQEGPQIGFDSDNESFDVQALLTRLTENLSVFKECDMYREAALLAMKTGHSGNQAQLLVQEAKEDSNIVQLAIDARHNVLFSTKDMLAAEQEMISLAKQLRTTSFGYSILAEAVLDACEDQPFLMTDEQKESALEACLPCCLSIIQGSAGAGKTTLMKTVVDIHEGLGSKVIGAANTKAAALNLEEQAEIPGYTVTRLLGLLESGKPPLHKNEVLIVDESGQLGTFQVLELMKHAKRLGFKLLLVGEDKQLDAIQHGGVLKYLSSPDVIGTTRIETIQRQTQSWDRQAVADFRDGYADKALHQYAKRDQLRFGKNHEETLVLMVDAWKEFIQENPDKGYLMMAQRWEIVHQLNAAARIHLKSLGKLGNEDITVKGIVSKKAISFDVSVGERIRLTENDYEKNLTNGHTGTVLRVIRNLADEVVMYIKLDSGRTVKIRTSEYCDEQGRAFVAPAYAQTVYASQGLTIDGQTFIHYNSSMDRANTYVACSRHKEKATIFANKADIEEYIPPSHQNAPETEIKLIAGMAACMAIENRPKLACEYLTQEQEEHHKLEIIEHEPLHLLSW